jgi:hypothetical protein
MADQDQEGNIGSGQGSEADQTDQEEFSPAVEQVEQFASSERSSLLERVLDRHLSSPLNEDSFKVARDAGMLVMGQAGFGLIVWIAAKSNRSEAIEVFQFSPETKLWVTGLVALYGDRLKEALHQSDVLASRKDDWEEFSSRVLVNPQDGEREITIEIAKFNGEKLVIEAGLTSVARLAERTLTVLAGVDDLSAIEDEDREELLRVLNAIRGKLEADPPGADD